MIDVMAGQVPVMFSSVTQVLPHARNGKLNVIAVGASKRTSALPDVPTVIESGYPGYEVYVWWGIVAPGGVPRPIMERLRRELNAIIEDADTRRHLANEAAEPMTLSPADFRKMMADDVKKWSEVARQANIRVK